MGNLLPKTAFFACFSIAYFLKIMFKSFSAWNQNDFPQFSFIKIFQYQSGFLYEKYNVSFNIIK